MLLQCANMYAGSLGGGGGAVLFMVGTPISGYFQSNWVPILFLNSIGLTPGLLSAEKISLSLSHLVPEILELKVGLIFQQKILFNSF